MRVSRAGIFVLLTLTVLSATGCNYYNKIIARKNLVDGAKAYKDRKFEVAENLFRDAVNRDPEQDTAQLFLARTLHSEFAADRSKPEKAEQAIVEYKKVLAKNPSDASSYRAVANLYENLNKMDEWRAWVTQRSADTSLPPEQRAEAFTSLAAKENTCANDITDVDPVKKTVIKDGKPAFVFSKPEKQEDYDELKGCIQRGTDLINQALALETDRVKNAKSVTVKSLDDKQLTELNDQLKPFESARSYKTSLLIQAARLAEMENRPADKDQLKQQSDTARAQFLEIGDVTKQIKEEKEARVKAAEEQANVNA